MASLSVLQVVEPGVDGAFRHVEGLVHFLAQKDVEVHLAYSSLRGSRALQELVSLVESRGGETLDMLVGPAPHPRDGRALLSLRGLVKRRRPQIVHGHSSKAGGLVRLLALAGMSLSRPTFYTPHAYFGMDGRRSPSVTVFNLAERLLGGIGTTINISPDEAAFARTRLGISAQRSLISHNPVNPDRFLPFSPDEKRQARRELGLPVEGLLLGSAGRLSTQKDPLLLTRAFARANHPELGLVHLGQGPLRAEVEAMRAKLSLDGRVFAPPYMDNPSLFYRAIDAFVMSSSYEAGWPIVVLEAMCCNLPLIVTTAPGMSEIGQSGLSHCWTAPPGQVDQLGQAIKDWLTAPRTDLACNHRDYVLEHFTPEKCYGSVLAAYRQASL